MKYESLYTERSIVEYLKDADIIVYDTETDGLAYMASILGVALYNPHKGYPVFIPTDIFSNGIPESTLCKILNKVFKGLRGIAHNSKYDNIVLKSRGVTPPELFADTQLMCHAYNPDNLKKLEVRVAEDLKVHKQTFEQVIGKKWHRINWQQEGDSLYDALAKYACEDAYYEYQLYLFYKDKVVEDGLTTVLERIEYPLVDVLCGMNIHGINIDTDVLKDLDSKVTLSKGVIIDEIYDEAGSVFNINSGKQKAEILYDKLGYPVLKRTKKGDRSTDADVLEKLATKGYRVCSLLVEYSTLQKLHSGYIEGIPNLIDNDGMLRCNFNSSGTRTGRMSADSPNLQNQPNNKDFPVRKAFIASPGSKLLIADYSQIELRIMAHVTGDKRFMNAFLNGEDIHGRVADDLGIERKQAKTVNFGVLYGLGPDGLAEFLGISSKEAKVMIDNYNSTYKGFYEWKQKIERMTLRTGEVRNMFNRVRRLPDIHSENKGLYYASVRRAVNTVIQGSAADVIKIAMVKVAERWKRENIPAHILLQVHDELICEAPIPFAQRAYDLMIYEMEHAVKLHVPLLADGKICDNWAQMKDDNFKSLNLNNNNLWIPLN